jgi:hypothetical protein
MEPPEKPPLWRETTPWRAWVRSRRLDWMRPECLAKEPAEWAMACRYLVATRVRVSSAESWVALKPTDWQICETAVLAMASQKSDGNVVVVFFIVVVVRVFAFIVV